MRGTRYVYRCSDGHLFSHSYWWWWYGGTLTRKFRGFSMSIDCPVGNHWASVRRVNAKDLTEEEREILAQRARLDDQDSVRLSGVRGLGIGVISLVFMIVTDRWWGALGAVLWIMAFAAVFIRGGRAAGDGS